MYMYVYIHIYIYPKDSGFAACAQCLLACCVVVLCHLDGSKNTLFFGSKCTLHGFCSMASYVLRACVRN